MRVNIHDSVGWSEKGKMVYGIVQKVNEEGVEVMDSFGRLMYITFKTKNFHIY